MNLRGGTRGSFRSLAAGTACVLVAAALAVLMARIEVLTPDPQSAVAYIIAVSLFLLGATLTGYLLLRRRDADPAELALVIFAGASVLLLAVYLFRVGTYLTFPADILIWGESDFVHDIVKLREGHPLYTAPGNNESQVYTPGAQLVTYGLALLAGRPTSIPTFRVIQLIYVVGSVILAVGCWRRLIRISGGVDGRPGALWVGTVSVVFILVATNMLTNSFVQHIHNDSLAQLVSMAAFWLLLGYVGDGDRRWLWAMGLVPAVGFLIKQSLAIWAPLYLVHLAVFDRPRSWRRTLVFGAGTLVGIGVAVGSCYLIWGDAFLYWVFEVLGTRPISPLRSVQHLLDGWAFLAVGLAGGFLLLRGRGFRKLAGPFVVWILFFGVTTYTSGAAWTRTHMGPPSLIAAIWLFAGLAKHWDALVAPGSAARAAPWLRGGILVTALLLVYNGLGAFRIPSRALPRDAHRYVREIEREFDGYRTEDVLLDMGSWIYLRDGVVMKDRASSLGDRGYAGMANFGPLLTRLREHRYAKILVRSLHSPQFWYDHELWPESSGVRSELLAKYREVGTIAPVVDDAGEAVSYLFSEVSVLVPRGPDLSGAPGS